MSNNDFMISIIAGLNKQLSKRQLKSDLKTLDNSMYVKVIAKLSTALSKRQLKNDLKQLNDLYVQIGANVKVDKNTKNQLQTRIKELQKSISDIEIQTKVNKTKLNTEIDSARREGQARANKAPVGFDLEIKKNKAISDIEYIAKKYSKLFSNVSAKQKYNNLLNSAYSISDDSQLRSVRTQISAFTSELKANDLASKSLGDKWKNLIDRSKNLFSAASIVTTVFSQVRQSVSTFLGLDTAMTDLYKVTNDITSREQFSDLLTKWNKLAQDLSVTTKSLIDSVAEWSKIGFDLDMSEQLAQITAIFEKTAEISNEKANATLISVAQAFPEIDDLGEDDYVERVKAIGDKINQVGNQFSIDSEGVSDALQNSSAALRMANNDLNESIAIVTTANKIFQSPDEVGNMSKVLSARLRGQRGELEALNEDTDGLIESVSKIQTQILNLTHNKVNIFESDNETLKSTYDIVLEIGKVFDTLSDKDQADLLEIIAGKQRMSAVASLLLNYKELEKVKEASMNADNSMQEEYNKYLESAEAHIVTFKEKLTESYSTFMSGDLIKYTADVGSGILDLINSTDLLKHSILAVLALNIGKGVSAIGAGVASTVKQMNTLGNALQQVKNLPLDDVLRESIVDEIGKSTQNLTEKNLKLLLSQKQLNENDTIRILTMHNLTKEEALAKLEKLGLTAATNTQTAANTAEAASTFTLSGALNTLKASAIGVGTAIKTAFLSNPLGWILMGVTTAVSIATSAISKHNQAVEEARQKNIEASTSASEEAKSLSELYVQYSKLNSIQNRTSSQEKQYKTVLSDITKVLGDKADALKGVTKDTEDYTKALKEATQEELKDKYATAKSGRKSAEDDLQEDAWSAWKGSEVTVNSNNAGKALSENAQSAVDVVKDILKDYQTLNNKWKNISWEIKSDDPEEIVEYYYALKEAKEALVLASDENEALLDTEIYKDIDNALGTLDNSLETYVEKRYEELKLNYMWQHGIPTTEEEYKKMEESILEASGASEYFQDVLKSFLEADFASFNESVEKAGSSTDSLSNAVKSAEESTISFKKAWKSLDSDAKDDLLELAKAGELTVEKFKGFEDSSVLMKKTGLSAEELTQKINGLVLSADQLASMKTGISSISDILGEKKDNLSDKKTKSQGIGADTLSGMPDEIKACTKAYKNFVKILGNGASSMAECQEAANKLATAYINNNNFLANLTDGTKDYYISVLKEMGVQNAEQIVLDALKRKKAEAAIETMNFTDKTGEEIIKLLEEQGALNGTTEALKLYALKKIYANGQGLNVDSDIDQLIALVKNLGYSTEALDAFKKAKSNAFPVAKNKQEAMNTVTDLLNGKKTPGSLAKQKVDETEEARDQASSYIESIIKKMEKSKVSTKVTPTNSSSDSKSKKDKTKEKESKQTIDWLSRMLDVLQSKIDLLKAKFDNLFSLKSKNNNLTNQISQINKLLNVQEKAVKRYQKIASNYYKKNKKKLSKNGITLDMLRNGSYDIKSYKSSIAEIIQTYEDYYDKAKEATKAVQETKTALRESKEERNQLYIDQADSKLSMLDAQTETALNAKGEKSATATNKILQKKVKWTKQYYNYQIKNAKLENDTTKVKELQAQKEKALLDIEIEKRQNVADEAEANYTLNQQLESNAISAKDKNKYESESLKNLKKQYNKLIEIAGLEGDITEQKRLQAEKQEKIAESYKKMYDNIKAEYDNNTSLNNAQISTVQAEISALEANGKVAGEAFYEGLTESTKERKEILLEELADLKANGADFEYGSDEWYAWKEDIESVTQELYKCDESLAAFQKSWNELKLRKFDLVNSELENANNHIDFLTDYLSHKDLTSEDAVGLTDDGFVTISLNLSEMENNNKIIENAQNGLAELQKQIADGTTKLTEEEQEEAINKYIELIRNAISANEDLKDSVLDLVEEAFTVQLDVLNELIEKRKKALQTEKDLYDYQRKIANQTKTITSIQKQIAALTGNTSEEARARLQKLQVSLEEAQQDLKDTEYDKWLSDQEDMLDDLSEEIEEFFENLMRRPEELLSAIKKAIKEQPELIANALAKYGLGDAHSFDTAYNDDGSKTSNIIDYGGNSYQNGYETNGVNRNNQYGSVIVTNTSNSTGSSDATKEETILDKVENLKSDINNANTAVILQPIKNQLLNTLDDMLAIASPEYKQQKEDAQKQAQDETKKQADMNAVYQRAESIMKQAASGTKNIVVDTNVPMSGVQAVVEDFLNSSALHKPTTEAGKKRMETDPLLKYIAKNYSGKTLSNANESKLGAYLGIPVKNTSSVTTAESNKILKAFKNAGFSQGGIAQADSGILKKTGEDGLFLGRNGEGFVRPEDVPPMKKLTDSVPTINNIMDNLIEVSDEDKKEQEKLEALKAFRENLVPVDNPIELLVKRSRNLARQEQTGDTEKIEKLKKLADNLVPLNHVWDYTPKTPDYSNIVNNHTSNTPVSIGDVNIHLDGSSIVDENSFVNSFARSSKMQKVVQEATIGMIRPNRINSTLEVRRYTH